MLVANTVFLIMIFSKFSDTKICGTAMKPIYVKNYTCTGNSNLFSEVDEMNARIREARLSFLSGHASLSWYGMTWAAGYLYMMASVHHRFTLPIGVAQVGFESYPCLLGLIFFSFPWPDPGPGVRPDSGL